MKRLNRLFIYSVAFVMIVLVSSVFAKTYKFGAFPIPLMVESKDKGIFIELTKEIAKRANVTIEIVVEPTKRILNGFNENQLDIIYPAVDVTLPKPAERTTAVYHKIDYTFHKSDKPYKTMKDLEGKKVGITLGYPYTKELTGNKNLKIETANDDITNFKKLEAGRIDAFVVEEHSGVKALKDSGVKGIAYDKNRPLSKMDVYYAFQKTPEGKDLAVKFSRALDEMKKDGTFARIMGQTAAAK